MVESIANAAAAYSNAALRGGAPGLEARDNADGSFGTMVRGLVGDAIQAVQQSEQISARAVTGHADINEVVMAVTNAEVGLQAVVGIRDKIIDAYHEIIRMPM